ncbi:MAG TPA: hypothetical protein VGK48_23420 [Terriglobia bacterium]|jgi:hypothetical protein
MEAPKLTAWQAFKELLSGPEEKPIALRVYNPFALKPADFVTIDDILNGIQSAQYQVTEVDAYRRLIGDRTYESVDYALENSNDEWLTIRVSDEPGLPGTTERTILLLFPDYEGEYDEELHKKTLPSGVLEIKDDQGQVIATYERLHGLKEPYRADVLVLTASENPHHESYEYWDFGRKTGDGREEFYFVEMSTETGMFHTWRAVHTSENELSFLRHSNG